MAAFSATLVKWPGKGGWTFAPVPPEHAPDIAGPWGRVPVVAVVDGVEWRTSAWRDRRHGWLLPVPKRVRGEKGDGDVVQVEISVDPDR